MLLKTIEIHGFKSFAEKTELELGKGVTCLVGPNGCGKSNVVDALKWALGEQRPTALRGDSMGDVIFKGNGRRPPMSFAEVTLVFDNEEQVLPTDTPEVAITRRLLRSGESEYLLNRRPARLKDIRELFFDTGLGHNAYAVLEQGRIDAILRANADERRVIFEEAAGVQRFRMRKREAARKLEKVDQNLLRVADLIDELDRRVRSLRIQAGRARSYVELTSRLTELKTLQFLAAGAEMATRTEELQLRLQQAREADHGSEVALADATAAVAQVESDFQSLRDDLGTRRTRAAELRAECEAGEERLVSLKQREQESNQAVEERERRAVTLRTDLEARRAQVAEQRQRIEAMQAEFSAAQARVEERREQLSEAQVEDAERATEIDEVDRRIVLRAEAELSHSNELASLESRARGLLSTRVRLVRRESELAGLLERVRSDESRVLSDLDRLGEAAREQGESIVDAREQLGDCRDREEDVRRRIGAQRSEVAAKESRRDTLDAVIEEMEGVDEGSRELVKAAREGRPELSGVLGLLGELVTVPPDVARAVDAALGSLAGAVVVESELDLRQALEFLRAEPKGPATFLVLERPAPLADAVDGAPGDPLIASLTGDDRITAVVRSVLGAARLVPDEDALMAGLGSGWFLVTADGMKLDRAGAFTDRPQKRALGFVERKVERDQLTAELEHLRGELRRLSEEEARLSAEVAEWTARVAEAERRKREVEEGILETRSAEERLRDKAAIFRRELMVSAQERFEAEVETHTVRAGRREHSERLAACRRERESEETRRRELVAARREAAEVLARLSEEASTAAAEVVRYGERVSGAESEIAVVERVLREQEETIQELCRERDALAERAGQAVRDAAHQRERLEQLRAEEEELATSISGFVQEEQDFLAALQERREQALAAARAREESREALHRFQLDERELTLSLTTLRERAQEEVSLDIDQRLTDYDAAQAPPKAEIDDELKTVRDKVSRLGNVNLDAIHELEEVEERLTFLTREKEDLDASRRSLESTIKELDAVSRDKFLETFEAVRENFRTLFRKLFHGGQADVQLKEGEDVLDAGIEIFAGPPGKDPRSITLLSGGERTMTALALLFALFKARPSPIAVLDEVDAALDEANTERFCNMLDDFIGESQFLIVTHSKRTMTYADVIFGVTMQESGVSKRIAIRMEDYETSEEQVA